MTEHTPTLKELLASQRRIDSNINGYPVEAAAQEEEAEQEEETSGSGLTVAKLREALEAAEVEIPAGAKKADLVALYDANELGKSADGEEEEEEELPTLEEIKAQYTVPQLKELLKAAEVSFANNAKEDDLAQLYLNHLSAE